MGRVLWVGTGVLGMEISRWRECKVGFPYRAFKERHALLAGDLFGQGDAFRVRGVKQPREATVNTSLSLDSEVRKRYAVNT